MTIFYFLLAALSFALLVFTFPYDNEKDDEQGND